ncbi:MAG: sigma-70 family RNA polymerase sigma factor [FCB group bacterium]|jgi:RNA polymerase sigma-70 factor (ECF subfamily)|nr:sigma-70 family RNA polymerase sigma factor [FCB group bacterium]
MDGRPVSKAEWIRAALDRFERPLLRYASRFTGDLETARDVVQDTFLKLCEADRAKVDGHLAAWLYTVCRNRALDVRKKEGRMDPLPMETANAFPAKGPSPGNLAEGRETQQMVLDALRALPERQQEAFRLKFQDELTYREIGLIMGVSLGTVSGLIAEALDTVRGRLRAGHIDLAREVQRHDA